MHHFNTFIIVGSILLLTPSSAPAETFMPGRTEVDKSVEISSKEEDRKGFPCDLVGGGTRVDSTITTADH